MKEDYLESILDAERRFYGGKVELREGADNKRTIVGYAAVFNRNSEDLGGFIERIDPKAFDEVVNSDIRALFNHDKNLVLGRNGSTMKLSVDEVGLRYEIDLPDNTVGKDLYESIKRGDVRESSFSFIQKEQRWENNAGTGKPSVRTLIKMARVFDVGPVTFPAYTDTKVASRSLSKVQAENEVEPDKAAMEQDLMKMQLEKMKI